MGPREASRQEKIDVLYILSGLSADASQLARAYIRGEAKGVKKNISQIISKFEKVQKRI